MKKYLCLLLSAVLLMIALLGGCSQGESPSEGKSGQEEKELPTLTLLIDTVMGGDTSSQCEELCRFLNENAAGCGEDYLVEVEALPTIEEPDKRSPTLTGLHMELLTGGPDVFLMRNFYDVYGHFTDLKNFFPYPASAMRQRLFLPLDEYMAGDSVWEKLHPQLLAAGQYQGSQQLVPLSFRISGSLADKELVTLNRELPMSGAEMLSCGDSLLEYLAAQGGADLLGVLADYEEETLSFTEGELLGLVRRAREAQRQGASWEDWGVPEGSVISSLSLGPVNDSILRADEEVNYRMIPAYNREGGVTARVEHFAAVNRSTEHPEAAYAILRALVGEMGQRNQEVTGFALPVYMGLGRKGAPCAGGWYLDQWDYEQLEGLQEQISAVEFNTPLCGEADKLFQQCVQIEEGELEQAVHEAYTRMRMMLAES